MITKSLRYAPVLLLGLLQTIWSDVLVLPFQLEQVDSITTQTINELFIESYQSFSKESVKRVENNSSCRDNSCALEAGKRHGAKEVVYGAARVLGRKWIVSGWRISTTDGSILGSNRVYAQSIEDFEFVMKRIAEGLASGKKVEETATMDNVTESEMSGDQYRHRQGSCAIGCKVGYLFPTPHTHSYERYVSDYTYDYYNSTSGETVRTEKFGEILCTDFTTWFELPKDLAIEWDIHIGWASEIGTHFSLFKLFSRKDITPFAGGGVGLDYVFPDQVESYQGQSLLDKRNGCFSFNGKVGMMFLRSYNFRIFTDIGYKVVANSDADQGATAEIGVLMNLGSLF
jgi:hypothetical protein